MAAVNLGDGIAWDFLWKIPISTSYQTWRNGLQVSVLTDQTAPDPFSWLHIPIFHAVLLTASEFRPDDRRSSYGFHDACWSKFEQFVVLFESDNANTWYDTLVGVYSDTHGDGKNVIVTDCHYFLSFPFQMSYLVESYLSLPSKL